MFKWFSIFGGSFGWGVFDKIKKEMTPLTGLFNFVFLGFTSFIFFIFRYFLFFTNIFMKDSKFFKNLMISRYKPGVFILLNLSFMFILFLNLLRLIGYIPSITIKLEVVFLYSISR